MKVVIEEHLRPERFGLPRLAVALKRDVGDGAESGDKVKVVVREVSLVRGYFLDREPVLSGRSRELLSQPGLYPRYASDNHAASHPDQLGREGRPLDRRLDDFDAQGVQGLILDLRNNAGGSLQTTDELLGRFLPDTARSVHELDQRGHQTFELAGGRLHARQLPMVVLINGGSASASEVTAAALRDAHRAILVGQKTAGAVASSELLPLPGGGGIQIAVAAATAESGADLDGVGVAPDVVTAQSRTLADYRSGHDPQLEAAVTALANAPAPPSGTAPAPAIGPADLDRLLEAALPISAEMPTNDRLKSTNRWQRLDYIHPNELIDQNGGAPDPIALQQAMWARGYQGSVFASYGASPGDLPTVSVNADMYATADGAHTAVSTNDLPALQVVIDPPAEAGDETIAYRGAWLATGATLVTWRRGRVVYTVTYADVPGFDRPDTVAAITQQVDARAQTLTIP